MHGDIDITTERTVMHRTRLTDFDEYRSMWSDKAVSRYLGSAAQDGPEEHWARLLRQAGQFALLGYGFWSVRARQSGEFLGVAGFRLFRRNLDPALEDLPEAGWVFTRAAQGQGFATEAQSAALAWADARFGWQRVIAMISHGNAASFRVASKLGFTRFADATYHNDAVSLWQRCT